MPILFFRDDVECVGRNRKWRVTDFSGFSTHVALNEAKDRRKLPPSSNQFLRDQTTTIFVSPLNNSNRDCSVLWVNITFTTVQLVFVYSSVVESMVVAKKKLKAGGATGLAKKRAAELQKEITRAEEESDSDEEQEEEQEENKDSEEQDSSEEESEEEEQDEEEEEGSDEEEDDEQEKRAAANSLEISNITSANGEQCTFDLRNLLGMNVHQLSTAELYSTKTKKPTDESLSIAPTTLGVTVNEDYILEKATDGCTQLVAALWQLPVERSDAGPMVFLPSYDEIKIPRALVSYHLVDCRRLAAHLSRHAALTLFLSLFSFICRLLQLPKRIPSGKSLPEKRASH
jgi:archaellum component FlaD/FlaE